MKKHITEILKRVSPELVTSELITRSVETTLKQSIQELQQEGLKVTFEEIGEVIMVNLLIQVTLPKVIASKNAKEMYDFANSMPLSDKQLDEIEASIIETKNAEYIYLFALNIKGANIENLEKAIIETKNAEYIYLFALNIKGANIENLENAIIGTEDAHNIYFFALHISTASIEKLANAMAKIKSNSEKAHYTYLFILFIVSAEQAIQNKDIILSKLEKVLIETKSIEHIKWLYNLRDEKKDDFIREFVSTNDINFIYDIGMELNIVEPLLSTIKNSKNIMLKINAIVKFREEMENEDIKSQIEDIINHPALKVRGLF